MPFIKITLEDIFFVDKSQIEKDEIPMEALDYQNDPEFQKLICKYLDYLQDSLPNLRNNISIEDFDELRLYGHNLTGSGGGYGFGDITEMGKKINLAAKAKDTELLIQLAGELENLIVEKHSRYFK